MLGGGLDGTAAPDLGWAQVRMPQLQSLEVSHDEHMPSLAVQKASPALDETCMVLCVHRKHCQRRKRRCVA